MVKKSEVQSQIDALTKQLESAEDDEPDEEVWVRNKDGHETRLTGKRAKAWMAKHGYDDDGGQGDGKPAGDGQGDDDGQGDGHDQDGKPPANHGYFRSRKG